MTLPFALFLLFLTPAVVAYTFLREYRGNTFFNDANNKALWSWYSNYDNLTFGNVSYLSQQDASSQRLAYVNSAGNVILKVDNVTNVVMNQTRNSIRITTLDAFNIGSLWIVDLLHVPYGCSLWPAFWSLGSQDLWPIMGEFDIFEAINLQTHNQMALHTSKGCVHITPPNQKGTSGQLDCSTPSGCVVEETSPNSYGQGFGAAGGGVWATQFDATGIYIWFWSRPNVPASVTQASATSPLDLSDWGNPSASYPGTNCTISDYFGPQYLIFDITLCGDWAGVPSTYDSTCANMGPTGKCYEDNVVGPGSPKYDNAYFEVSRLIAYTTGGVSTPTAVRTVTSTSTLPPSTYGPSSRGSSGGAKIMSNTLASVFVIVFTCILLM